MYLVLLSKVSNRMFHSYKTCVLSTMSGTEGFFTRPGAPWQDNSTLVVCCKFEEFHVSSSLINYLIDLEAQ